MPIWLTPARGIAAFAIVAFALGVSLGVRLFPPESTPLSEPAAALASQTRAVASPRPQPQAMDVADEVGTSGVESIIDTTAAPASSNVERVAPATVTPPRLAVTGDPARVAGAWTLETTIESSSLSRFEGLRLGYRFELRQDGDRIVGTGRKVTENGVPLQRARQTPIAVRGTIDGSRLSLTFAERGVRRDSQGRFNLVMENANRLRGHFSSDAARSAGVVEANRL